MPSKVILNFLQLIMRNIGPLTWALKVCQHKYNGKTGSWGSLLSLSPEALQPKPKVSL